MHVCPKLAKANHLETDGGVRRKEKQKDNYRPRHSSSHSLHRFYGPLLPQTSLQHHDAK